jgi:hypothetical protein
MEPQIILALALALTFLGQWLTGRAKRRHRQTLAELESATLQRSLALLQALQKHRGLGAQQDLASSCQRRALARQLDQLWLNWPGPSLRLPALQQQWPQLRRKPADFAAHCQVIEALLTVIEQLEARLAPGQQGQGLGQACRTLEDLARLRGLAVRAANYQRCPAPLQAQLRELCQQLAATHRDEPMPGLLRRLQQDLIEAAQPRLTPLDCFALFTPLIEQRWQRLPVPGSTATT